MDIKGEFNKECSFPDTYSQNATEVFTKDLVRKVKSETIINGCGIAIEQEEPLSHFVSQSQREDGANEKFPSIESQSFYQEGGSSYKSDEDLRRTNMIIRKHSTEHAATIKSPTQETDVIYLSSVETGVCPETPDGCENDTSGLTQHKLLPQNNINQGGKQRDNCTYKSVLDRERPSHDKGYTCIICKTHFMSMTNMIKHAKFHSRENLHKCSICSKSHRCLRDLKRHTLIHEGKTPLQCNICGKFFTESSTLKDHEAKAHKCNICNKIFAESSTLKRHKVTHEAKVHKCNICEMAFNQITSLKRHQFVHADVKPYGCNICDKAFAHPIGLKSHKLIHKRIKRHKCIVCEKDFYKLSDMNKHILSHTGEKPHKCNICNKAYTRLTTLKKHKSVHEDEKL